LKYSKNVVVVVLTR